MIEHTVDLITTAIKLASNPLLRPLQKKVLELVRNLRLGDDASRT